MRFAFTDDQEALRHSARRFLAERAPLAEVRRAADLPLGFDPDLWRRLGRDLGWTAITTPEPCEGLGLGHVDLAGLMEVMGGALLAAPFFTSACLAVDALRCVASPEQQRRLLPAIAAGDTLATLALTEPSGRWEAQAVATEARPDGDGFILNGVKRFVPDGAAADLLLVVARAPGSAGERGLGLFPVPADAPGLTRRALPTMDATRPQAALNLDGVRVAAALGDPEGAWPGLRRALDLAAVALAAEQVGGAQRCLDMAVEYAKIREQFDRPIGSFQAIKHMCADMMVQVECARSACYFAAWVADEDPDALPEAAALARIACSEAFFACAAQNIQIHGGVGFAWEHDAHLYFKRARSTEILLGDPDFHRDRLAAMIGLHTNRAERS